MIAIGQSRTFCFHNYNKRRSSTLPSFFVLSFPLSHFILSILSLSLHLCMFDSSSFFVATVYIVNLMSHAFVYGKWVALFWWQDYVAQTATFVILKTSAIFLPTKKKKVMRNAMEFGGSVLGPIKLLKMSVFGLYVNEQWTERKIQYKWAIFDKKKFTFGSQKATFD